MGTEGRENFRNMSIASQGRRIMRFFHLSDLHIGKQLHGYNLSEDQHYILQQVVEQAAISRPDAIVIAGDIYDKSVPSAEAVTIFDEFLTNLAEITPAIPILIISGNHDSAERLDYASQILGKHHIYIAGMPPRTREDKLLKVDLTDEFGSVHFYLMPFVKPGYVRNVFEEAPETYDEAVRKLIEREKIDYAERNVLVSHQFYTWAGKETQRCSSELISVGGVDNVDISAIAKFDYAALGHIHGAQKICYDKIRYSGTLLKYSVSEQNQHKVLTVVTLGKKEDDVLIEKIELLPLRNVREIHGNMEEILALANEENRDDYVSIILTDEVEMYRPMDQLREVYSHILELRIENARTRAKLEEVEEIEKIAEPLEAFTQFFEKMQLREMTEDELEIITEVINKAKEA